jgi:hypothetical protein
VELAEFFMSGVGVSARKLSTMMTVYPHSIVFTIPSMQRMEHDFRALVGLLKDGGRAANRFEIARIANKTLAIDQITDAIEHSYALFYGALCVTDRLLLLLSKHPDMLEKMVCSGEKICRLFRACLRQRLLVRCTRTEFWLLGLCIVGAFSTFYKTHGKQLCNIMMDEWHYIKFHYNHTALDFEGEFLARDHDRHFLRNGVLATLLAPPSLLCRQRLAAVVKYIEPIQCESMAPLDWGIDLEPCTEHKPAHKTAKKLHRLIFRRRTLEVAIALQYLSLPVLMTLGIIDELLDNHYTMHYKWELLKAVKHFR